MDICPSRRRRPFVAVAVDSKKSAHRGRSIRGPHPVLIELGGGAVTTHAGDTMTTLVIGSGPEDNRLTDVRVMLPGLMAQRVHHLCLDPVSYTHLDVYKRQVPA